MLKKIIILIAVVGLVAGVVLCVGRGVAFFSNTDGAAEAGVDSEPISVDDVKVDKSGDLVYVAPSKKPAEIDGRPAIWIE